MIILLEKREFLRRYGSRIVPPAVACAAMNASGHMPVLAQEVLRLLSPRPGDTVADLTVGLGGHAALVAERIGAGGTIAAFDVDGFNLAAATARLHPLGPRIIPIHARFTEAAHHLASQKLRADVVLADLGFSSNQMDDAERGFSFAADGPLDMRLDRSQGPTAADLVANLGEQDLADLIYRNGEEPFARRIARKLAQIRLREPIRSTARLAEAVVEAYGPRARASRMHPATRTFMALRIAVNDELGSLQTLLDQIARGAAEASRDGWLNRGARIGIISFHSLEDRMVKHAFANLASQSLAQRLTKKPVIAAEQEIASNPRARSAKLRAISIAPSAEMPH